MKARIRFSMATDVLMLEGHQQSLDKDHLHEVVMDAVVDALKPYLPTKDYRPDRSKVHIRDMRVEYLHEEWRLL